MSKELALESVKSCARYIVIAHDGERMFTHIDVGDQTLTFLGGLEVIKAELVKLVTSTTEELL